MNFTAKLGLCNVLVLIATVQLMVAKEVIETVTWEGIILMLVVVTGGCIVFLFNGNQER